jgi:hypothetical protein
MTKTYIVELTKAERECLSKLISAGTTSVRMLTLARILLKANVGEHAGGQVLIDRDIA